MKPPWRRVVRGCEQAGRFIAWHLGYFFAALWRLARWTGLLLTRWRRGKITHLFQGLSALAACLTAAAFAAVVALTPAEQSLSWCGQQADQAVRTRDWPTARLALERLAQQNPDRPEYRYHLAVVLWEAGEGSRALALLRSLTPNRGYGYAPAHIWLAKRMLFSSQLTPQLRATAVTHLQKAIQSESEAFEAHALLGQLYAQTRETTPDAVRHLLAAQRQRPELALTLARLHQQMGEPQLAHGWAETARQFFRTRLDDAPDAHDVRLQLADALLLLDDYPAAIAALRGGLLLATTDSHRVVYRRALARAHAFWARSLPSDAETRGQRLALVEAGLQIEPSCPELLLLLGEITRLDGAEADKSRALLQRLLAQGQATATLHMVLGADAYHRDKLDEARLHFEQANRLDPRMSEVANNLACVLAATGSPADLTRALELMHAVLGQAPTNPHFRETRGQIYAKLGRWKEAVADLETALPGMPDGKNVHRTLAEGYKRLGLLEIAAEHEKLAGQKSP